MDLRLHRKFHNLFYTLALMKLNGTLRIIIIIFILALNIGCDQATKSMMRAHINYYDHYSFFNDHVTLLRAENMGAFLSLGDKLVQPFRFILLTLLPILALLGALAYIIIKRNLSTLMVTGIIFCIGGGISNLYDRVMYGSVTDFIHIKFGALQTGVFNAADVSIMMGLGLVLLDGWLSRKEDKEAKPEVIEESHSES